MPPLQSLANIPHGVDTHTELFRKESGREGRLSDQSDGGVVQLGASVALSSVHRPSPQGGPVPDSISSVLLACSPGKIRQVVVRGISVKVACLLFSLGLPSKSKKHQDVDQIRRVVQATRRVRRGALGPASDLLPSKDAPTISTPRPNSSIITYAVARVSKKIETTIGGHTSRHCTHLSYSQ